MRGGQHWESCFHFHWWFVLSSEHCANPRPRLRGELEVFETLIIHRHQFLQRFQFLGRWVNLHVRYARTARKYMTHTRPKSWDIQNFTPLTNQYIYILFNNHSNIHFFLDSIILMKNKQKHCISRCKMAGLKQNANCKCFVRLTSGSAGHFFKTHITLLTLLVNKPKHRAPQNPLLSRYYLIKKDTHPASWRNYGKSSGFMDLYLELPGDMYTPVIYQICPMYITFICIIFGCIRIVYIYTMGHPSIFIYIYIYIHIHIYIYILYYNNHIHTTIL